jgi:hypothetical protein
MKWAIRTCGVLATIAALVLCAGIAIGGVPKFKNLPTGQGVSRGTGRNVLLDPGFSRGGPVAMNWLPEYSTTTAPFYLRHNDSEEIAYVGNSGDSGLHRKIEIFQSLWHGVYPGQRWRFSMRLRGQLSKAYIIVGMEWFSVHKPLYKYIAEQDVYPQVTMSWQQVTVVSPPMPKMARCVAVYVQLPEINPMSRIDVWISGPSLILTAGT